MTKYIVIIDYKASYKSGFDFVEMNAKNIIDAMEEANEIDMENVYMISIAEKEGKMVKDNECKKVNYRVKLDKRSSRWNKTDYNTVWQKVEVKNRYCEYTDYKVLMV